MAEEENRTLKNEKSEVFSEKEVMEEELRLAYARISELEIFIDRIKLGNQSRQSRSNTSLSGTVSLELFQILLSSICFLVFHPVFHQIA